ncbi:MAG TPA: iron chelate uptake ABC transporter family permease subunit, partial [Bacillota bacterium]|nr:iron chelate uptake ABC transporter family permease subunit [Bacillota bacterium]
MTFIQNRRFYRIAFISGIVLLIGLIIFAANLGVAHISWRQSLAVICSRIPLLNKLVSVKQIDPAVVTIIYNLRLPRILLATLLGAGLAVAGAALQGIFKNAMADPFVLGISSGAALGASLAMVLGITATFLGIGIITIAAFGGGIATVFLVYNIARIGNKIPSITLLLSGIAVNLFLTSLMSLVMTFKREQIERIVMWTMGSVATANWTQIAFLLPVILLSVGLIMV